MKPAGWIEQKNGAVVRKLLGYRRFAGIAAARAITRLYAASRLFVNFFQPSFKLATEHRDGARVSKRYHLCVLFRFALLPPHNAQP